MIQPVKVKVKRKVVFLRLFSRITFAFCFVVVAALPVLLCPNNVYSQDESSSESLFRIELEKDRLIIPCPKWCNAGSGGSCNDDALRETDFKLIPNESGFDMKDIWFEYLPEAGEVVESAANTEWHLWRAQSGSYWLRVKVNRGFETIDVVSKEITISACNCECAVQCSGLVVEASRDKTEEGQIVVFRVLKKPRFGASDRIEWSVENGQIISGAGSSIIKVRADAAAGSDLKVIAKLKNDEPLCQSTSEKSVTIIPNNEDDQ